MANKKDLINMVAEKTDITKKDVSTVVDAVFESIKELTVQDGKLSIVGHGSYEVRERAARKGVNPSTGESIDIPATKVPAFKAGKEFKETVKNS